MKRNIRAWGIIEFRQDENGEWLGHIRGTFATEAQALAARGEFLLAQPKGQELDPELVRVRSFSARQVQPSVMEMLAAAENASEIRDILVEARLKYQGATPATKRKWESFAVRRELALNSAPASLTVQDKGVLSGGSSRLLGADGRPIQ